MQGEWIEEPGPALTSASALRRLAGEPRLCALVNGARAYVACPTSARALHSFADLNANDAPPTAAIGDGWSGFAGGAIVQLDYEFPAVAGRAWDIDAFAAWDQGRCSIRARDTAAAARLRTALRQGEQPLPAPRLVGELRPAWDAAGHRRRVDHLRERIAAGDCYQGNLTMAVGGELAAGAQRDLSCFLALDAASPAPYAAFLRSPGRASVVSHSPECFLHIAGDAIESRPIKGTRRRVPGRETALRRELLESAKDRAELAMIVDLVRNDLGRVAVPGSVQVAEAAEILDLPYVHHLVATVRARRRGGISIGAVVAAAFPAGSITGAPKIAAMRILHELEGAPRGPYCGSFGWIAHTSAQLAVAIRTLVVDGTHVALHAGGGIVADSDPAAEWDEVRAKASAMATALGAQW